MSADRAQMESVAKLMDEGKIHAMIGTIHPLGDGRAAYESGRDPQRPPGKSVLAVQESVVAVTAR